MMRLITFAATALLVAILGAGCIFEPRDADPPSEDSEKIPLDDALDVFASMREGLEKDAMSNYERAIGDDFIFSPLLSDSLDPSFSGDPNAFENWTRETERDVTNLLLSESSEIAVEFNASREISENTFVRFRTEYDLTVIPAAGTDTTSYKGVAFIDVRRRAGIWQVDYWDEIESVEGFSTWGFLRGTLRQRLQ